jgi:hypothetical protein
LIRKRTLTFSLSSVRLRRPNGRKACTRSQYTGEFYVGLTIIFILVGATKIFFPALIPFDMFEFFRFSFNWETLSQIPWVLLLFGPILTIVVSLFTKNGRFENQRIKREFDQDIWTSIKAGIFEEAAYRWLSFYFLIALFSLRDIAFNWLMSVGWIAAIFSLHWLGIVAILVVANIIGLIAYALIQSEGTGCITKAIAFLVLIAVILIDITLFLGLVKWWYTDLMIPLVNLVTLGKLGPQLLDYSWMVGAALVSSNWSFGEGHIYQGCVGWANSWIIGMLMFWFAFNFGLPFAMFIHALYDVILRVIRYADANAELTFS